jgi:hypothetical protein
VTDVYRIRAGNHRIIYQINDGELLIIVVDVGGRVALMKAAFWVALVVLRQCSAADARSHWWSTTSATRRGWQV